MDFLLISHNYILVTQVAMLTTLIIIYTIYHYFTIEYIIKTLIKLSVRFRYRTLLNIIQNKISNLKLTKIEYLTLNRILYLHSFLCQTYMYIYKELWGLGMFYFFLSSIPFSVICLLLINNKDIMSQFLLTIICIFFINSMVIIMAMVNIAFETETLHQPRKYLPSIIQQICFNKYCRLKLRVEDLFYRLTFGTKYGPFIANFGPLTYNFVLQVSATNQTADLIIELFNC